MPRGYIIARVDVTDADAYARYAKAATPVITQYGGRVLARGGTEVTLEGDGRARNIVIEFESLEQALRYYHSPEYAEARALREHAGIADFVAAEGC